MKAWIPAYAGMTEIAVPFTRQVSNFSSLTEGLQLIFHMRYLLAEFAVAFDKSGERTSLRY
jgi:hypothetical protein